jgi:quercetin dioxygenase-like cupin family protein
MERRQPMHHVGTVDWSFATEPLPLSSTAAGISRARIVGPDQGAVHTDLYVGAMQPGGWLAPHVHAYEEVLYILEGELLVQIGEVVHRLVTGDYALFPTGVRHALGNTSDGVVRWLSLNSPVKLPADAGRKDTFFEPAQDLARMDAAAVRPPFGDPTLRLVGHYEGTPPQLEALAIKDAARGRAPAGMDTALIAYSGISVRMLVDRVFGADHVTMFTVDYELGGAAQQHDHPFEEAYFFLEGEIEAELDGQHYTLRAGDIVFAPVGSVHGFYNIGTERVRWIETQAPQPPARHSYRWVASWERYEASRAAGQKEQDG